ncbi:coiled-coil domain-containing protein 167 isoform X4 [Ahaetulla prasina]|uniref:coiled-coil domain-containing protein 167 isoform X4 n=1 Tax=Ahaetulla prasina TaxID=499056 RepID=UPI002649D096|nr:coiled-coil domain-containing protein 167 isoform X4 [Ahaetulla prasina]XP_058039880.1 coiled-coil domain-containing protein 167 isoform X4 [Ahaetulla prasina]
MQFQQNAVSTTDEKEKTGFACFRNEQVESLEDKLTLCRQALEEVDFKLRREELTSARRESLEKEKNMLETKAEIYDPPYEAGCAETVTDLKSLSELQSSGARTFLSLGCITKSWNVYAKNKTHF